MEGSMGMDTDQRIKNDTQFQYGKPGVYQAPDRGNTER